MWIWEAESQRIPGKEWSGTKNLCASGHRGGRGAHVHTGLSPAAGASPCGRQEGCFVQPPPVSWGGGAPGWSCQSRGRLLGQQGRGEACGRQDFLWPGPPRWTQGWEGNGLGEVGRGEAGSGCTQAHSLCWPLLGQPYRVALARPQQGSQLTAHGTPGKWACWQDWLGVQRGGQRVSTADVWCPHVSSNTGLCVSTSVGPREGSGSLWPHCYLP